MTVEPRGNVVALLTYFGFEQGQNCFSDCHQFRIMARSLNRTADGRAVDVHPVRDFAPGDRQIPGADMTTQRASTSDLRPLFRAGCFSCNAPGASMRAWRAIMFDYQVVTLCQQ
jgi:hypothetical protein